MMEFIMKIKAFFASIMAFLATLFGFGPKPPATPVIIPDDPAIVTGISDEDYFDNYFKPVLRFAAASDVHIDDTSSDREEERLAQLYETAYSYSDAQEYNKLDGVFFAGDISNRGTSSSMDKFFGIVNENCRAGTLTRAVLGNHEFYTDSARTLSRFLAASGYETSDADIVLGGYHFIMLCPNNNGNGYSEAQLKWLDSHISDAVASDPTGAKPVFVFQHHNVKNTVYGSQDWGVWDMAEILAKYPQVVDFSGHSHYPINDPRSIWQGSFTALGDGTLSYYEMGIAGVTESGIFPSDNMGSYTTARNHRDAAQYYIVEVSRENSILIKGYDILSGSFISEYRIRVVGNTAAFDYTDARRDASAAPYFGADDVITAVTVQSTSAYFRIPQANGTDPVQHYRFEAYDGAERKVAASYSLSDNFYFPAPDTICGRLTGLTPDTDYTVKCYPVNCWAKEGAPLTLNIHTKTAGAVAVTCYDSPVTPDVFSFIEMPDGSAYDGVSGEKLTMQGYPQVTTDEKTGRPAVIFSGWDSFRYDGFKEKYNDIKDGVTFEYYGELDALYSRDGTQYVNPFANLGNGGCGFECSAAGKMQFWVSVNGSYVHPGAQISANVPVHVTGTFDGEKVCVYINGELKATENAAGTITFPADTTNRYLCIGGDSGSNGATEGASAGKLVTANVYSRALTAEEVALLYQQYR